jgi:hypothetical protein
MQIQLDKARKEIQKLNLEIEEKNAQFETDRFKDQNENEYLKKKLEELDEKLAYR